MRRDRPDESGAACLTIIIGDGRMRASSGDWTTDQDGLASGGDDGFRGMTFAEALRRNGLATQTTRTSGATVRVEDRGGAISLLDIADAFEELTEQSRRRPGASLGQPVEPADCALRRQLIACIAQGRVY